MNCNYVAPTIDELYPRTESEEGTQNSPQKTVPSSESPASSDTADTQLPSTLSRMILTQDRVRARRIRTTPTKKQTPTLDDDIPTTYNTNVRSPSNQTSDLAPIPRTSTPTASKDYCENSHCHWASKGCPQIATFTCTTLDDHAYSEEDTIDYLVCNSCALQRSIDGSRVLLRMAIEPPPTLTTVAPAPWGSAPAVTQNHGLEWPNHAQPEWLTTRTPSPKSPPSESSIVDPPPSASTSGPSTWGLEIRGWNTPEEPPHWNAKNPWGTVTTSWTPSIAKPITAPAGTSYLERPRLITFRNNDPKPILNSIPCQNEHCSWGKDKNDGGPALAKYTYFTQLSDDAVLYVCEQCAQRKKIGNATRSFATLSTPSSTYKDRCPSCGNAKHRTSKKCPYRSTYVVRGGQV